jgi:uncharacterized protein (DUF934 family)
MPLLKDGKAVEDTWVAVADGEPIPADRPAILPLERWKAERESLRGHNGLLGVRLASNDKVEDLADDLDRLALIALDFPKFQDGRAYSSARILRERMGYKGELRAVGNVLADQFLFMHRCGFDAYDVADPAKAAIWDRMMAQFSVFYQPTADGRRTILQQRGGAGR